MKSLLNNPATKSLLYSFIIAAAATACYIHVLDAPFVYDDLHTILRNPPLRHHENLLNFFTRPEFFSGTKAEMYRPLLQLSYVLNFRLGDENPVGFRIFNLILHILCSVLVYRLTRIIPGLEKAAFPAALIFSAHPLQSETVIYISSRSTLLASLFILSGLIAFIRSCGPGVSKPRFLALSAAACVFLAAGLASKSVAAVLPVLALAYVALFVKPPTARHAVSLAGLFIVLAGYLTLRRALGLYTFLPPETVRPLSENLLTQACVSLSYIRLILFPAHLSLAHDAPTVTSVFDIRFILSACLWLVMLALAALRARKSPLPLFFMFFFIAALLPTSSIIPLVVVMSENRLYLASLGLIWPLSVLSGALIHEPRLKRYSIAAFALLFACFFILTVCRGSAWKTSAGLWRDAVSKAPENPRAHVNYGIELKNMGQRHRAEMEYKWAARLDPQNSFAYSNLANLYFDEGRYKEARLAYERAIETAPANVNARYNLSKLLLVQGIPVQAAETLEKALEISPHRADIRHDLGIIYFRYLGEWTKGREQLERSLELDPGQSDAQMIRRAIEELKKLESIQEKSGQKAQ